MGSLGKTGSGDKSLFQTSIVLELENGALKPEEGIWRVWWCSIRQTWPWIG
jgi:hypothetical protein